MFVRKRQSWRCELPIKDVRANLWLFLLFRFRIRRRLFLWRHTSGFRMIFNLLFCSNVIVKDVFEISPTTDKLFRTKFAQKSRAEEGRCCKKFSPNFEHFLVAADVRRDPLSTFSQRRQRLSTLCLCDQKFLLRLVVVVELSNFFRDQLFEGGFLLDNYRSVYNGFLERKSDWFSSTNLAAQLQPDQRVFTLYC